MIRRLGSMSINMVHCWVFQKSFLLTVLTRFQIGFRNIRREAIANLNIGEHPCCIAGDVFIRECKPFPNRDTESWAVGLPLVASGLRPFCLSSIMSLSGCHIGVKSVSSRLSGCHSGRFHLFNVQTIFMNSMGPSVFPTQYPLYV